MSVKEAQASVKGILSEIRTKLGDEEASKIGAQLSAIEREVESVVSELNYAESESIGRKKTIRELKAQIEETGDSESDWKEKLKKKDDEIKRLKSIEKEHTEYVAAEQKKHADIWAARAKKFEVEESDPIYPKVQEVVSKFTFGTEETPLTPEQVKANNALFEIYDEIGHFGKPDKKDIDGKVPTKPPAQPGGAIEAFNDFPES